MGTPLAPAVLRAIVACRSGLGRDGLARDAVALVRPRCQVEDAAAVGAERTVRVALPVDLAAARRATHSAHGAESSRSRDGLPGTLKAMRPRVRVSARGTRRARWSPRPQLRSAARRRAGDDARPP